MACKSTGYDTNSTSGHDGRIHSYRYLLIKIDIPDNPLTFIQVTDISSWYDLNYLRSIDCSNIKRAG